MKLFPTRSVSPTVGGPSDAILSALMTGPLGTRTISELTGIPAENIRGACNTQRSLGNITRVDGGNARQPATYAITDQGVRRITPHLPEDQMQRMGYQKLELDGKVIAAKPAKDGHVWIRYAGGDGGSE